MQARHEKLLCGLAVIDLRDGRWVGTFEFTSGVEEIFDIQVVPGARCPALGASPGGGDDIWLLPAQR